MSKTCSTSNSSRLETRHNGADSRFLQTEGRAPFNGNELLVKGALEAGASLLTGYPGSPVSEFFDVIHRIAPYLNEKGIVGQIANNEALAAARLNGARQAGLRGVAVMKSVGYHVASDALAVGNLMEVEDPNSGSLIILGDDPWNETTQINSDSRYLSQHLHIPVLTPSTFQEIKDWIDKGLFLSGASDLVCSMVVTTNQADGGGVVTVHPNPEPVATSFNKKVLFDKDLPIDRSVLIPPHTSLREATLAARKKRFLAEAKKMNLNQVFFKSGRRSPLAFVASGFTYLFLKEALKRFGLWGKYPILKLGVSFPLDVEDVQTIAEAAPHLVFVEEKRGFIEDQFSQKLLALRQEGRLSNVPSMWGKQFPDELKGFPEEKGLNASEVMRILGPALLRWKKHLAGLDEGRIRRELAEIDKVESIDWTVPARTPTFCSGCPHRDSAVVAKETKEWVKVNAPTKNGDLVFQGESGCHSMLQFAPFEGLMQSYSGMGVGGGTGAGMSPFIKNPQVVFLGDSTFFHSGIVAVSDAVKNNQNITFVILENDTTAMTGHQPTPGNRSDIQGNETPRQDIESSVRSLLPKEATLRVLDPGDRVAYQNLFRTTVTEPGVKVIISQKECAITAQRRIKSDKRQTIAQTGFLPVEEKIGIATETCEYCLECAKQTACPGLEVEKTPLGDKLATSLSQCVDDGACARTKACPSFEKVTIKRTKAPKKERQSFETRNLPKPIPVLFQDQWNVYTAGVGGMGTGVVTEILAKAAAWSGLEVSFLDKKGLAIRNGAVFSHVVFTRSGQEALPVIPYGGADVILGLDPLETARSFDPKGSARVGHPERTRVILNRHRTETVLSLTKKDDFDVNELTQRLASRVNPGSFNAADFSDMTREKIGSPLHANVAILGAAFQKGWLPVTEDAITRSIANTGPKTLKEKNLAAFQLGREWALEGTAKDTKMTFLSFLSFVEERENRLTKRKFYPWGKRDARLYKGLMRMVERWMDIPWEVKQTIAQAAYDLFRYEGASLAERYLGRLWDVYRKDRRSRDWRATKVVALELYRAMAIKDEFWVAELLTSPEKYEKDRQRYKIDESNGDKIEYVHFNRPKFVIFGKEIEFEIETKDWMLKIFSKFKFARYWFSGWHKKEREFLSWYDGLVARFDYFEKDRDYDLYVKALEAARDVRGFRDIRYPTIEKARAQAESFIADIAEKPKSESIDLKVLS